MPLLLSYFALYSTVIIVEFNASWDWETWSICFHSYSSKIMLRKDKFSWQHFKKLSWTLPTWAKFLELIFFHLNKKVKQISPEQKSTWGHIIFIHKFYNEIADKIRFISLKAGQKWNLTFFGKLYLTLSLV